MQTFPETLPAPTSDAPSRADRVSTGRAAVPRDLVLRVHDLKMRFGRVIADDGIRLDIRRQ